MKRIVGTIFAGFLALVLFFVLLPVLILPDLMTGQKTPDIPTQALLELDLGGTFTDQPQGSSFGAGETSSVIRIVEGLARAEDDERVSGLFVTLPAGAALPIAQAEEIRDALKMFRAGGKFVIVHARSFQSSSLGAYYAAAQSDELWLQPSGEFADAGLLIDTPFAEGRGERHQGVFAQGNLEGYAETIRAFTQSGLPDSAQDAYGSLVQSIYDRAVDGIAASRGLSPDQLRGLLEGGRQDADAALAGGLVSHLGAYEEARGAAMTRAGRGAGAIPLRDYLVAAGTPYGSGDVIAVVHAEGSITSGGIASDDELEIDADVTVKAIRGAAVDENIKAILLRVESDGGSAMASRQIWEAMKYASNAGKPVVVSMGGVAASGGYYIATAADRVIAQPSTITGSIGVVDGKYVMGRTFGTLGLTVSETAAGGPGEQHEPISESGPEESEGFKEKPDESWQAVNRVLGNYYTDFTIKVAEGRGLSLEAVHEVASGRVWSGAQAKDLGLVDDLGGYRYAIGETKRMIGLDANSPVELRAWPAPAGRWQRLAQMRGVSGSAGELLLMFSQFGQVQAIRDLMGSVYNRTSAEVGSGEAG